MGLVSTAWVAKHLQDPDVRICDVRWYLAAAGKRGSEEYEAGHLPGAAFVDLDAALAAPDDGRAGRHPLPVPGVFEAAMRAAGVSENTHVVAYDDVGGAVAARLWWLLRASGHDRVSLLDGGVRAWTEDGYALETDLPRVPRGTFAARFDPSLAASLDDTRAALKRGAALLDARAPERYRGAVEPVDQRPGHIPGAINVPVAELLDRGRFRAPEELRERFKTALGPRTEVIASCGSGVTACHLLFAMELASLDFPSPARLYVGSYSEWSRRPRLPVVTGDAPGEPP